MSFRELGILVYQLMARVNVAAASVGQLVILLNI